MLNAVDFSGSNISHLSFSGSTLQSVNFFEASLYMTSFEGTKLRHGIFANNDLSKALGLEGVEHTGNSTLGIDTVYKSCGQIPDEFLRDAGIPMEVIALARTLRDEPPIQWLSCFISYSTKDVEFARQLRARIRETKTRVWFAPEDMKSGDYFSEQIERAIQLHDRLLLVLSDDSIQSKWVEREIRKARKIERTEKRRKLFPIRLMDMKTLRAWECLDVDTGEDLAEEVRKYHIPDFSNWKDHDAFEKAFARLQQDLKDETTK
jgi:hypothetical protein